MYVKIGDITSISKRKCGNNIAKKKGGSDK